MAGPTLSYLRATRCFPSGDQRAANIFSDPGTICTRPVSRSMIETCRSCFGTTSPSNGAKSSFFPSGDQFEGEVVPKQDRHDFTLERCEDQLLSVGRPVRIEAGTAHALHRFGLATCRCDGIDPVRICP